jgi:hypothetical protein
MIPAITKGKLKRWILLAAVAVIIVFLFCGSAQADDIPRIVAETARHREFMAGLYGYEDHSLCDIRKLRPGLFGVIILCPVGFQETLVYDTRNGKMKLVCRDIIIPRKSRREAMRRESIRVGDAVRVARRIREPLNKGREKAL